MQFLYCTDSFFKFIQKIQPPAIILYSLSYPPQSLVYHHFFFFSIKLNIDLIPLPLKLFIDLSIHLLKLDLLLHAFQNLLHISPITYLFPLGSHNLPVPIDQFLLLLGIKLWEPVPH